MLHSFTLLIATLAVTALAAPAPLWNLKSFGNSGAKNVHGFKASSRGHGLRGHRNPLAELSRIYNKFHWSVSLPTMDGLLTFEFPPSGSSSSQGSDYGSYGGSDSGSNSGPSYGSGDGSDSGSAGASDSPLSVYSTAMTVSATAAPAFTTAASLSQQLSYSQAATATASAAASSSPSAAPSDGSETGEVTASPEENESEYLSPVTIGGQKLNLNFDTGSADLWVFSTSLSESERGQHSVFDPTKSSTWKEYEGGEWQIQYGDGSGASGTVGYDTVDVGGATVTGQAVELATQISSAFVSDENNDGLLGLAFGKINTVQPEAQKTFFENIADDLDEKVFTADLDIDASGTYEFGKVDTSKYQGELHTTPIDTSNGFWQFESSSYSIGGKDSQSSNASPAIADTGTSLMMVDDAVAEAYYAQIDGAQMSQQAGGYVYPCDADVPSFGVAIGDSGFMAHINGSDIEYARVGSNSCFGGVQGNSGQGLQIFGAVLLKQYFAVFNFGDETFGLALKAEGADSGAQQQQGSGAGAYGAGSYGEGSPQGYYKVR